MASPSSPWSLPQSVPDAVNLSAIMKLEKSKKDKAYKQIVEDFNLAKELSVNEVWKKLAEPVVETDECGACSSKSVIQSNTLPNAVSMARQHSATTIEACKTPEVQDDDIIAQLLQAEFDLEFDGEIKRLEASRNKNSKISISLAKYRLYPDELLDDESEKEDEDIVEQRRNRNWDRFVENDKEMSKIGRMGYREENGKILTKHDENLSGRKNAGKIMEIAHIPSGDCANFDMKVSNKVFNELRNHSNMMSKKKNQARLDRKADMMTNEMGVDLNTRLILYKLINTQCILDNIDGIVSTGKEAVILHGETNQNNEEHPNLPKEVAIKIFSTTLNEFKQRDRYIKDDFRFKGASKQNNKNIIQQWCEKELHNLTRLKKAGIPCPEVVVMKKHVLVMSYIGRGHNMPAPKLKEVVLSDAEWICAYDEVVGIMKKMYDVARLVHADFSEYNILYHEGHCVVIDLAQAVEPLHPAALEFLMRDCDNITNFFERRSVPVISKEELFFDITKLDPLTTNTTMLERIHMKGEAAHVVNRPMNFDDIEREKVPEKFRLQEFPFDYAWSKVEELKEKSKNDWEIVDLTAEDDDDDEWVQVKSASKKKQKRKSESVTIIDKRIGDSLKEISVSMS